MVAIIAFCTFAGLLRAAASRSLPPRSDGDADIPLPKLTSDFGKNNISAPWAAGYPKKWGSEDYHRQFNDPSPGVILDVVMTEDERYLSMYNGSHVTVVDLDTNTTVTPFKLNWPEVYSTTGLTVRSSPRGGYDAFTSAYKETRYAHMILRQRISPEFKPIGDIMVYTGGEISDFDKKGRMVLDGSGIIYNLDTDNPDEGKVTLKNNVSSYSDLRFSGDGQYLSAVGWQDKSADLWNTTTGEKILQFPPTNAQNWVTRVSPDNKWAILSLGTGYIQVYSLQNLTAAPRILPKFKGWIRTIEWSPDGKYLATGDPGRVQLWKFPEAEVIQTWEVDSVSGGFTAYSPSSIGWLDDGNKLTWNFREGRYMYDFEKNVKYWWTVGYEDHTWGRDSVFFSKKSGIVVTGNGDATVRFWKI